MKVLQVNSSDLQGRIFNGFDLHLALIEKGIDAAQLVIEKHSDVETVLELGIDPLEREKIAYIEERHCVKNVFFPYADKFLQRVKDEHYDIMHFHFLHHKMFSLLDYPRIFDENSVWTIHDPWILTGNCTYPLDCDKWRTGCKECNRYDDIYFPMKMDNTEFMWNLKKEVLGKINPHIIVASRFTEDLIKSSPLTCHFTNIHRIPFGIETVDFKKKENGKIVIGFRAEDDSIKGTKYLYRAFEKLAKYSKHIELQCVGRGTIPGEIKNQFKVTSWGWISDRKKMMEIMRGWDIFAMPSLAETFGLMAIEAMSCQCAVVCFKGTAVEDVTEAPKYALAATYADSQSLAEKLEFLIVDKEKRVCYQQEGYEFVKTHYKLDDYVDKHIALYRKIMKHEK